MQKQNKKIEKNQKFKNNATIYNIFFQAAVTLGSMGWQLNSNNQQLNSAHCCWCIQHIYTVVHSKMLIGLMVGK
jgi:hypothetical protein